MTDRWKGKIAFAAPGKSGTSYTALATMIQVLDMDEDMTMAYPKEGTSAVPDGCALVKGNRHVENAKLFIDFTVSDDVQQLAMDQFQRRTVRKDLIQEEGENDIKIMDYDLEWASSHQDHILTLWSELME